MDWDANNLYGHAMIQPLPYKDLRFTDTPIGDIVETSDHAEEGHDVEIDFHILLHLHDKLREYPPAPENLTPDLAWFSDFQKKLGTQLQVINKGGKYVGTNKLVPHLMDHENYVIHYRKPEVSSILGYRHHQGS